MKIENCFWKCFNITHLTLVNIFMSVRTSSPTANTVSSIGLWISFCLIFEILCVVEYGIILHKKYPSSKSYSDDEVSLISQKIDHISLYFFPLLFVVFNLTFWPLQY